MSASTLENIGDELAEGVVSVFTADGTSLPLPAYGPRNTAEMALERIEVRAGGFIRASDQMASNGTGGWFYNHRRGTLSLTIVTQRHLAFLIGADSKHGVAVGRVRYLLSKIAQKLTPSVVGGYEILDLIDLGDVYDTDRLTQTDRTEIRFQVDLTIPGASYT